MLKFVCVSELKANCASVINQLKTDGETIVVTRRGVAVALLSPIAAAPSRSIIGAMKGSVGRYDDPFLPAVPPESWDAMR